ncbi:nucleoside phosphorylase domain-containing protein [Truncatella angustata]|uniref:Nucleoside phosphorylase domain-containing protein n=1 Tax=Truncatella angustata TaxID=152316 RepID=A0A9P8URY0_9PEZI|nr:nucleoside phosphorylase domain-containing protein [Truncatella angustata]KAH6657206.1 nucleoside phosphorylase domain-containing protein [Truncatella angustata]
MVADYKVGWICALPKEQTAAVAMLDVRHASLSKSTTDYNTYTLGSIGDHDIVIACLPKGKYGTTSAATVATRMLSTFPAIRFGLMVGIGGGIPPKVRLGDVVVSVPTDQYPGVVQWDMGKAEQGGTFRRTGALNNPPTSLLTALTILETEQAMNGSRIPEFLDELARKYPRLTNDYLKSESLKDILFKAACHHANGHGKPDNHGADGSEANENKEDEYDQEAEEDCRHCDPTQIIKRKPRDMKIHYGLIASGDQVIKDAARRRRLVKELGGSVLCVETEAAGLVDNFPCIVVRGICAYADSHKNKAWQEHAAAVAAAFTKELLGYVTVGEVEGEKTVKDILSSC